MTIAFLVETLVSVNTTVFGITELRGSGALGQLDSRRVVNKGLH
jgi:hypothetical protein